MIVSWAKLTPYPKLGLWRTNETISLYFKHRAAHMYIPANFFTDLATVPNWAWQFLSCNPNHLAMMGLIHDYSCRLDAQIFAGDRSYSSAVLFDDSLMFANEVMLDANVSDEDRWKVVSALKFNPEKYWRKELVAWRPRP